MENSSCGRASDMDPITSLSPTRRLVTGHNERGKAVFEFDEVLNPFNPYPKSGGSEVAAETDERPPLGITLIHRTREYPVKIQGGAEELASENVRRGQGELGIVCQIVDLPPTPHGETGYLHRNQSLDYGVVLKGSMQILLDDGVEQTLTEGDVYVQKGTIHAWKNITSEYCRFLTVVIPSQQVKIELTEGILEVTKIPALSD